MKIKRGMVIDINLDPTKGSETGKVRPCIVVTNDIYNEKLPVIQIVPITEWSERKARISTNVTLQPSELNGLSKPSVADCLQTRPVDYKERLVAIRGNLEKQYLAQIDDALKIVFELD
jgi:mRNA interferase MazF